MIAIVRTVLVAAVGIRVARGEAVAAELDS